MKNMSKLITQRILRALGAELALCVLLPSLVLVSADVVAQKAESAATTQSQQQSDDQTAEALNSRLMASNTLRPLDLGVWVHDGVATLSGTVPSQALKARAEALARTQPGVKSIDDQIVIGSIPSASGEAQPQPAPVPGQSSQQANGSEAAQQETPDPNTPSYSTEAPPSDAPNARGNAGQPQNGQQSVYPGNNPPPNQYPNNSAGNQPAYPPPPRVYGNGNGQPGSASYPPAYVQNAAPNAAQIRNAQRENDQPRMTIAQGTPLRIQVMQTLDSHHTKPGDNFQGVLAQSVIVNGVIALPRGASIDGTVIDARPAGHLEGKPRLALQLSNVTVGNASYVLTTQPWAHQGPGKGGQTAGAVAGGAAFGAIAGAMVGGGPVALLGAAIGGIGGAGLSALSPSAHVIVPAESVVTFRLTAPLVVREPTVAEVRSLAANAPPVPPTRPYPRRAYYPYGYPYAPPPPPPGYYPPY